MTALPDADEIAIPALLRAARGSYARAVRQRLQDGGFADLPRNGPYVLGGLVNRGGTLQGLVRDLGVSKQAASQLIENLVVLGYLLREEDPADRRRITLGVTKRGRAAAAAVRAGIAAVDDELAARLAPSGLDALRAGLLALCEIRDRLESEARAQPAAPTAAHSDATQNQR